VSAASPRAGIVADKDVWRAIGVAIAGAFAAIAKEGSMPTESALKGHLKDLGKDITPLPKKGVA